MSSIKILIICRLFPPTPGIGGRRWVKFAKYLNRKNFDISVIAEKSKQAERSNWSKDIEEFKDKIEHIPNNSLNLYSKPKTVFRKVLARLTIFFKKAFTKGNYFDPVNSYSFRIQLQKKVESKILAGYNTIVVTGAPFRLLHHIIKLKQKYPHINLIGDLRDPWDLFGIDSLSSRKRKQELKIQKDIFENYDKIISVYKEMTADFSLRYKEFSNKFHSLANGFDKDDYSSAPVRKNLKGKIKFIYAGTVYNGASNIFNQFLKSLSIMQKDYPSLYSSLQFDFYGTVPSDFESKTKPYDVINYHGKIPLSEAYTKIAKADYVLLFLIDSMNYSLSTKFYEYVFLNKPILLFANGGEAGQFVSENNLGYFADGEKTLDTLLQIMQDFENENWIYPKENYDVSQFDIENLTDDLVRIINK